MKRKHYLLVWLGSLCAGILLMGAAGRPTRLATIAVQVDSDNDVVEAGACSLRAAIDTINTGVAQGGCVMEPAGDDNLITFAADVNTIVLTDTVRGGLYLTNTMTIIGDGIEVTGDPVDWHDTILRVGVGVSPTISNLILSHGNYEGSSTDTGGGISNAGGLMLLTVEIVQNQNGMMYGGGINNTGLLTMTNSAIMNNSAYAGAGLANYAGQAWIINSRIEGNVSQGEGGGIYNVTSGGLMARLYMQDSSVIGNAASGSDGGGGIYVDGGTVTLDRCTINRNEALSGNGGGISILGGTISYESANVTVSDNWAAGSGGGIFNYKGVNLNNVTVYGNSANSAGSEDKGGGVFSPAGTIARVKNTIIAGNHWSGQSNDCDGTFTSEGNNLIGNNSECAGFTAAGDLYGTALHPMDPRLAPLADNGGPTLTHALLAVSPALNHGNNATCNSVDQRGVLRPQPVDSQCDIGAFESDLVSRLLFMPLIQR